MFEKAAVPHTLSKEEDHGLGLFGNVIGGLFNLMGYVPPSDSEDEDKNKKNK